MEKVILLAYLVILSVFDMKERRVPVVLLGIGFGAVFATVVYNCIQNPMERELIILSAVLGGMPGCAMLAVAGFTKKVGYGDGLVLMQIGMSMGYAGRILIICFSLLIMSFWCIGILCCKRGNRNTQIPYLPFLTAVYLVGLFF